MTPIRVRGKRGASKAEKWHAGKKRKAPHALSPASSTPSFAASVAPSRKRKRRERELSQLEQLPTEILQDIFWYSVNLDLPLASPGLQSQLSGQHVYTTHTSRVFAPVLGQETQSAVSEEDVSAAARLISCKFFTWDFFKVWLEERCESLERPTTLDSRHSEYHLTLWSLLDPPHGLLPPMKVLRGPWSEDKTSFLAVLAASGADISALSPLHGETAYEGLEQAVAESAEPAVRSLLQLQLNPDTELVRKAVIDYGCHKEIVRGLVDQCASIFRRLPPGSDSYPRDIQPSIDFLDPALWAWAEKTRASGEERGGWLVKLLREKMQELSRMGSSSILGSYRSQLFEVAEDNVRRTA